MGSLFDVAENQPKKDTRAVTILANGSESRIIKPECIECSIILGHGTVPIRGLNDLTIRTIAGPVYRIGATYGHIYKYNVCTRMCSPYDRT